MANRLKMAVANAIITLNQRGWSHRRIARELGIDRETVKRHLELARNGSKPTTNVPLGSEGSKPATNAPPGQRWRRLMKTRIKAANHQGRTVSVSHIG